MWLLGGCALLVLGDEEGRPGGSNELDAPVFTGVLELAGGEKREGVVAMEGESIVVRTEGRAPAAARLDEIARLETTDHEPGSRDPAGDTLLSGALPSPWQSKDIGRTVLPGRARWKAGQFMVFSSPQAAGERFDAFHLVYMPMKGDGEIVARVVKLNNPDENSYAGVIMCDGLTPENRKAVLGVHPFGERGVSFRRWGYQAGNSTAQEIPSLQLPYWVKLVREQFDVKAYYSPDGRRWRFLKESSGRMRDEQIYVGLAVRVHKFRRLSEVVIDHVSVNGVGRQPGEAMLPHVVLNSGSRLAADIVKADGTAFHLKGWWKDLAVTAAQVARVEFFHPLPEDHRKSVQGERAGVLLRSGDFAEGTLQAIEGAKLTIGSVLFGSKEHSVLDEVDALVLRRVTPVPAAYRVETRLGSVLLAQKASLVSGRLVLEVAGLGEARIELEELRTFQRLPPR